MRVDTGEYFPKEILSRESDWSLDINNTIRPDALHLLRAAPGECAKEAWLIPTSDLLPTHPSKATSLLGCFQATDQAEEPRLEA